MLDEDAPDQAGHQDDIVRRVGEFLELKRAEDGGQTGVDGTLDGDLFAVRCKEGLVLHVYQFREGGNGNGLMIEAVECPKLSKD